MWTFVSHTLWWGNSPQFEGLHVNFKRNVAISVCYYKKSFVDLDFSGKNANISKRHRAVLTYSLERDHVQFKIYIQVQYFGRHKRFFFQVKALSNW